MTSHGVCCRPAFADVKLPPPPFPVTGTVLPCKSSSLIESIYLSYSRTSSHVFMADFHVSFMMSSLLFTGTTVG